MQGTGSTIIRLHLFGGSCNAFANRLLNAPNSSRTVYKFKHHFPEFIVSVNKWVAGKHLIRVMIALLIPCRHDL